MTELEILQFIKNVKDKYGNNVFKESNDEGPVKTQHDINVNYTRSFYRKVKIKNETIIERIKIRAANHHVVMRDWENNGNTPWENKYNIDIVFSNDVSDSADKLCSNFFVIEEYVYRIDEMTPKKLQKIINAVLNVGEEGFNDPLKKAQSYVLQPYDINTQPPKKIQPPTDGSVHPHQIEVWEMYEKSKNTQKTNESRIKVAQKEQNDIKSNESLCINNNRKIYKTNMTHIKRIDEFCTCATIHKNIMNENVLHDNIEKYRSDNLYFIDLITGIDEDDDDDKYALTFDGLIALYRYFYSTDIDFFLEFIENVDESSDFLNGYALSDFYNYVKLYIAYKLLEDVSEEDIIKAVEDEEYRNYLGSGNDMFCAFDEHRAYDWAEEIRERLKELRDE